MILKPISLALADVLSKDSVYLPLTAQHKAKLLEHVPAGEETILTITDSVNTEYVRVKNQQGTITLERGVESGVYKFPKGSCVYFEVSVPVVEWLICNYECCKGDCPVPKAKGEYVISTAATNATGEVCVQQGTIKVLDSVIV